jgi:hypothetical protein
LLTILCYNKPMTNLFTKQELQEVLNYDQETGIFVWSKKRRGIKTGQQLGADNGFGYLRITVFGKSYYAHRLAWFYVHGVWPDQIDHINGTKSDNRIKNLRSVSLQQNAQNKIKAQKNNSSKVLGVSWNKKAKKWAAYICVYKQRKYLGLFNCVGDAEKAYKSEKEKISYE